MSESSARPASASARGDSASVGEVIDLLKDYAKQETLGPLQGAGRWLMMGAAGALCLGLGLNVFLLGILRVLQTELHAFDGAFSWVPYVIVFTLCVGLSFLSWSRVKQATLGKEPS
ncbi:MAG: hypothetical protein WCG40_00660 [Actinomycetes bacterium]